MTSLKIISIYILSSFSVIASDYVFKVNQVENQAIQIEKYTDSSVLTCLDNEILNEDGDLCINVFDKVGWINRTDDCQGVRASGRNPNMYYLRSLSSSRATYPIIPEGYHWMTKSEYITENGNVPDGYVNQKIAYDQCGLFHPETDEGNTQRYITFSDSPAVNLMLHVGYWEFQSPNHEYTTSFSSGRWFGIVVYKD